MFRPKNRGQTGSRCLSSFQRAVDKSDLILGSLTSQVVLSFEKMTGSIDVRFDSPWNPYFPAVTLVAGLSFAEDARKIQLGMGPGMKHRG